MINIRKFKIEDAEKASIIIEDCFKKLDIQGHTDNGIKIQIEYNYPENLIKKSKEIKYYVAIDGNKLIGICGYDKYKIYSLFVDINYHKKGIGDKLLTKVLLEAKHDGLKNIITWSTIYAEDFYKSFGFEKIKKISIPEETKDIILIEMKKDLMKK
jgi:N-acetylglutamate synthase-like GNAT family acetyltransferase